MMYNTYIHEKLAHAHRQELIQEAEQRRLLAQLPRRHPQLIQDAARRMTAFFMSLPFSIKRVERPARPATGQL